MLVRSRASCNRNSVSLSIWQTRVTTGKLHRDTSGVLVTLTTTHRPATDLGYLLHKHPDKAQEFGISAGTAHVFYPVACDEQCTAALMLDIDPIALVRGNHDKAYTLGQYVNDRPYAAGSMLAVAISTVFRSAMNGVSPKQELADRPIPLVIHTPALPVRGETDLVARLFAPLGWHVETTVLPLDPTFPDWGDSHYVDLRLTASTITLSAALKHLYVLLPVLDNAKHYWISEAEIDKLLRAGEHWLPDHPERELISRRYLRRRAYINAALARLADADDTAEDDLDDALGQPRVTETPDRPEPLAVQRHNRVIELLTELGAQRVADLGCGGGALLRALIKHKQFTEIVGVDVSAHALAAAERRFERTPERVKAKVTLRQSALTYLDESLTGFDGAVLMEVIEHVDETRLPALERAVFGAARPRAIIVTTPNAEYNVRFETLAPNTFRHPDHRFEWTREQFSAWAAGVADRHGYTVRLVPIGDDDAQVGPPTQAAVFEVIA
jgi:3' terminal RNA ribose 2'-O-methyltransferase Hen1